MIWLLLLLLWQELNPGFFFAANRSEGQSTLAPRDNPQNAGSRRIARHALFSEQSEQAYGAGMVMRINEALPIDHDKAREGYLQGVLDKLTAPNHSDAVTRFTVYVIDAPYVGSFYVPGGFVYVTTGTLAQCQTEAEVAAVLAHQVGHVARRHWAAKQSRRIIADHAALPIVFFVPYIGQSYPQFSNLLMEWYVNAMPQREEKEADSLGAQYLYNAGYDPSAAVSINERLLAYQKQHPEWTVRALLSCTPDEERLDLLAGKILLYPPRVESLVTTSAFEAFHGRLVESRSPQQEASLLKFKQAFGLLTKQEEKRLKAASIAYKERAKEERKDDDQFRHRSLPGVSWLASLAGIFRRDKQKDFGNDPFYGLYYFNALRDSNPTLDDPRVNEFVNRLTQNLAWKAGVNLPFQVAILRDPRIMAGAFPGGYLYISTGVLQASDSEDQLAGVLAHEIAHVQCRHWHRERLRGVESEWGPLPLMVAEGITVPYGALFGTTLLWEYARPMLLKRMIRSDEAKADDLAIRYLLASGYDPEGYPQILQKIFDQERRQPFHLSRIRRDHPDTQRRIERTGQEVVELRSPEPLLMTTEEFARVKAHLENILRYGDHQEEDASDSNLAPQAPAPIPPRIKR